MGWVNRELRPDIGLTRHFVGSLEAAKRRTAEAWEIKTDMETPVQRSERVLLPSITEFQLQTGHARCAIAHPACRASGEHL
jgi:hypothetical protein